MTATDRRNQQKIIKHWQQSATNDWEFSHEAYDLKRYHWALFLAHLTIEKLLKALVVQTEQMPPFTHSLIHLADLAKLKITLRQQAWLKEMQDWNIAARYDDEKLKFYKKATRAYVTTWLARVDEVRVWLIDHLD